MTSKEHSTKGMLPEYDGNPFISGLPALQTQIELIQALEARPMFHEKERQYPYYVRKHCLLRLTRYFEPMQRQIQLAERFGMLLRQGYIGRNPLTHDYIHHLQNGIERIEANDLMASTLYAVENTAMSFALIGCSGMGKSRSIEKILHQIPQRIHHDDPFSLNQLTWLKLDCPFHGSPKQLCINFFASIDRILGTKYLKHYGKTRSSIDEMMVHMAHIANLHALGVLIIDEIQHLHHAKLSSEALLNFLVTLVNTIGVPIILIGTSSATSLLQDNFRHARRANGLGSLNWDNLPKGKTWDHFIDQLWQYQWTNTTTPISPEIRDVLYDESQGILDVVVKLFMLAQMRLISISEIRESPEIITTQLLRKVASEDFSMIAPMIKALRENDTKALLKYDDLKPLQQHIDQVIAAAMQSELGPEVTSTAYPDTAPVETEDDAISKVRLSLSNLGVAEDIVEVVIKRVVHEHPSADILLMLSEAVKLLSSQPTKKARSKPSKPTETEPRPILDLRDIVAKKAGEQTAYDALSAANLVKLPHIELTV